MVTVSLSDVYKLMFDVTFSSCKSISEIIMLKTTKVESKFLEMSMT